MTIAAATITMLPVCLPYLTACCHGCNVLGCQVLVSYIEVEQCAVVLLDLFYSRPGYGFVAAEGGKPWEDHIGILAVVKTTT